MSKHKRHARAQSFVPFGVRQPGSRFAGLRARYVDLRHARGSAVRPRDRIPKCAMTVWVLSIASIMLELSKEFGQGRVIFSETPLTPSVFFDVPFPGGRHVCDLLCVLHYAKYRSYHPLAPSIHDWQMRLVCKPRSVPLQVPPLGWF